MTLPRMGAKPTSAIVALLLVCFGGMSFNAAVGKSATYDEPLHLVGGMVHRYAHDFRINPEDPALFGWWASLPHKQSDLSFDESDQSFKSAAEDLNQQWPFVIGTLFEHDPANAQHFLNMSRGMFVILGMGLGTLIACWAYQIGGGWAAILGAALFCLDPNFLAHSSLVKNDVPLSLMMCLFGFFIWRLGRGGGWHWLLLAAVACGIAFNVKFSAILFGPILILLLLIRAVLPIPWSIGKRPIANWRQRIIVFLIGTIATLAAIYFMTWTVYGFRYAATVDGKSLLIEPLIRKSVRNGMIVHLQTGQLQDHSARDLEIIENDRVRRKDFALPVKVDLWMRQNHVLPEAWLFGFLFTYANTLVRPAFLLGSVGLIGWSYYFPLAFLFKTPTATLIAAIFIAPLCAVWWWMKRNRDSFNRGAQSGEKSSGAWTICTLTIPPVIYLLVAMSTNLNLGVRHILPLYPYLFVSIGVGGAALLRRSPIPAFIVCTVLLLGLLLETVGAYPNFIPFFNVASSSIGSGFQLLGDSNLDWGQDLPALAEWQRENPDQKLWFCYFGSADPNAYGVHFINMTGGWAFSRGYDLNPSIPGVVAISATELQGIYLRRDIVASNQNALKGEKPFAVLNKTIYLYRWPPK